jgi:hypothetical protein
MPTDGSNQAGFSADKERAAPTLLVGVGRTGCRVIQTARGMLAQEPLYQMGALEVLLFPAAQDKIEEQVEAALVRVQQQPVVDSIDAQYEVRQPAHRYIRLVVAVVAAASEAQPEELRRYLRAALSIGHPAVGMGLLVLLDVTHPESPNKVADSAPELLSALEEEWRRQQEHDGSWGTPPRLGFLVAHPHRADGSFLLHPNLAHADPSTPTLANGRPPDEFEAVLASALACHVRSGAMHDRFSPGYEDLHRPPFAVFGWAGDALPRELLFQRAATLLAADVLDRASRQPEDDPDQSSLAAALGERWNAWLESRKQLLDPRGLVKRVLQESVANAGSVIVADYAPPQPRKSLYRILVETIWGEEEETKPVAPPLVVRMAIPHAPGREPDVRKWPNLVLEQDKAGAAQLDEMLRAMTAARCHQVVAEEIALTIARCADLCIRCRLGGVHAALRLMQHALELARSGPKAVKEIEAVDPPAHPRLGLPPGASLSEAWSIFKVRCERLPGWPAVLARALSFGALATVAATAGGYPQPAYIGLVASGAAFGIAWYLYAAAVGHLQELRSHLGQMVEAKYGRRLLEFAKRAAGTPEHEGLYQAIAEVLASQEIPIAEAFRDRLGLAVTSARRNPEFPAQEAAEALMATAEDAATLRDIQLPDDDRLAEIATELMVSETPGLFASWRYPAFDRILARVAQTVRRKLLHAWEAKTLGQLKRDLLQNEHPTDEDADRAFFAWVRDRMDRLATRSVPLAILPPAHLERDNRQQDAAAGGDAGWAGRTSMLFVVPDSLRWHEAQRAAIQAGGQADSLGRSSDSPPEGSAAADHGNWFGADVASMHVVSMEGDVAAALVLTSGLSAQEALCAVGRGPESPSIDEPATPVSHSGDGAAKPRRRGARR